jgi:lipopolysaccharide/colanic/teichoic acid biosynthesis glycosyltransferase
MMQVSSAIKNLVFKRSAILIAVICLLNAPAMLFYWYSTIWWFDILMHFLGGFFVAGLYDSKILYDRAKTLALLVYTQLATAVFSVLSFYVLRTSLTPKLTIFIYVIFSIALLSLTRGYIFNRIQRMPKVRAVFFGKNKNLLEKIVPNYAPFEFEISSDKEFIQEILSKKVNNLVYDEKILDIENSLYIESLKQNGVNVFSYNQYFEFLYRKVDFDNLYLEDLVRQIAESKETIGHYLFRRFIDIVCAILIYPFYLLSLPFVKIGIWLQDGGDIFSTQDRVSFLGKRVWVYKFRTMTSTDLGGIVADTKDKNEKSKFGNVVTPFGKFLRKTRIDELPQCINLFRGDISLIGPRADIIGVYEDMKINVPNYLLRFIVPQGLTGWAQVHMNFPPRTHEEHRERLAFELYYIRNRSVLLDVSIILKTIKTLLSREGA